MELVKNLKHNFFGRLTRGEFGLAATFWLFGGLVGFFLNFVGYAILATTALIFPDYAAILTVVITLTIIFLGYGVLVMTGIWRAAGKYEGAKIWPLLAKTSVIFSAGITFVIAAGYLV